PRVHHLKSPRQERVGHPEIQMGRHGRDGADGERADLLDAHGPVAMQTSMLGGHLAGAVGKAPRRIGVDGPEPLPSSVRAVPQVTDRRHGVPMLRPLLPLLPRRVGVTASPARHICWLHRRLSTGIYRMWYRIASAPTYLVNPSLRYAARRSTTSSVSIAQSRQ